MKILVLGATGMLGNTVFKFLSSQRSLEVIGTIRNSNDLSRFSESVLNNIIPNIDVESYDSLLKVFAQVKPNVVINCIGVIKQLSASKDVLSTIPLNSLLPHRLAALCELNGSRLVHISTDCVFSGKKGNYLESDVPDAEDLYGRSKLIGEVDYPHAITLRTSIIGHELNSSLSVVEWFLSQQTSINGYTKAIFSGLPTIELAEVIHNFVLPNKELHGVYHVASQPISKFDLLKIVARVYNKNINIIPYSDFVIDRSLNAERFNKTTGYKSDPWENLVQKMHDFR